MRGILNTTVPNHGVKLPGTNLVEDPAHAELESHQ